MQDWQKRVVEEKAELDGRIERLHGFMTGRDEFWDLDEDARYDMRQQLDAMRAYSVVLARRIERFQKDDCTGTLGRAWDEPDGLSYELFLKETPAEPAEKRPTGDPEYGRPDWPGPWLHVPAPGASPDELIRGALQRFVYERGRLPGHDEVLLLGMRTFVDLAGTRALVVDMPSGLPFLLARMLGCVPIKVKVSDWPADGAGLEIATRGTPRFEAFQERQCIAADMRRATQ